MRANDTNINTNKCRQKTLASIRIISMNLYIGIAIKKVENNNQNFNVFKMDNIKFVNNLDDGYKNEENREEKNPEDELMEDFDLKDDDKDEEEEEEEEF